MNCSWSVEMFSFFSYLKTKKRSPSWSWQPCLQHYRNVIKCYYCGAYIKLTPALSRTPVKLKVRPFEIHDNAIGAKIWCFSSQGVVASQGWTISPKGELLAFAGIVDLFWSLSHLPISWHKSLHELTSCAARGCMRAIPSSCPY